MSYSEKDGQVVLTMSREDYELVLMSLGAFTALIERGAQDTEWPKPVGEAFIRFCLFAREHGFAVMCAVGINLQHEDHALSTMLSPSASTNPHQTEMLGDIAELFNEIASRLLTPSAELERVRTALVRMLRAFTDQDSGLCIECGEATGKGPGCDTCYVVSEAERALHPEGVGTDEQR